MRATITHGKTTSGLLKKTTYHAVEVTVQFTAEERSIITTNGLQGTIVLERSIPAHLNTTKSVAGFINNKIVEKTGGHDNGRYNLFIGNLLEGTDSYSLDTPLEAKVYEGSIEDALGQLKRYIDGNTPITETTKTLEFE